MERDHPKFDEVLDKVIGFMQESGAELDDIDAFKADVERIDFDEDTNEISLKLASNVEVEND